MAKSSLKRIALSMEHPHSCMQIETESHRTAYSPAEVAEMIGATTSGVRAMINRGDIPAVKIGRRLVRIPAQALIDLGLLHEEVREQ